MICSSSTFSQHGRLQNNLYVGGQLGSSFRAAGKEQQARNGLVQPVHWVQGAEVGTQRVQDAHDGVFAKLARDVHGDGWWLVHGHHLVRHAQHLWNYVLGIKPYACATNLGWCCEGGGFVAVHEVAYSVVGFEGLIDAICTLHSQAPKRVCGLVVCLAADRKLLPAQLMFDRSVAPRTLHITCSAVRPSMRFLTAHEKSK